MCLWLHEHTKFMTFMINPFRVEKTLMKVYFFVVFVHGLCTNDNGTSKNTGLCKQQMVEKLSKFLLYIDIYAFTAQKTIPVDCVLHMYLYTSMMFDKTTHTARYLSSNCSS